MNDPIKRKKILDTVDKILKSEVIPDDVTGTFPFTLHLNSGGVGKSTVKVTLDATINV